MQSLPSPPKHCRSSWRTIGLVLAVSAVPIGVVLLLHFWQGIPIGSLTRDPTAILEAPLYTGFLSQIGLLLWSASAAVCMLSAKLLSGRADSLKINRFLFVSGLLTLVLGLDDVFLLHEGFFPSIGVPEKAVFVSYAGFLLFYLVKFYPVIWQTEYILLGMALVFFGVSSTLDLLLPSDLDLYLFEDGAKLVGIVSWLSYFSSTATFAVGSRLDKHCRNV
ncbi:hypothetical protein [Synechococcus sp. PCC 7336]|uniref:hypothetical protein n=1 Tax=Synechococcus sp. PCC 7336 TaxID=195250 RepID=UPI0012EAD93F|nr:hypothetical protein [Synechococcus sp. PCC 7336]